MIKETLQLFGLSENESKVYEFLLQNPDSSGTKVKLKTGVANSQVYEILAKLVKKGIVTYKKNTKGKIYKAHDPSILNDIMEERKQKIAAKIPYLKNLYNEKGEQTDTAVYEGFHGFKTAMYALANECPEGETINIIGFSNQVYKNEKLAAVLRDVNKISKSKNHKFRMILDNRDNEFIKQRKKEGISNLRFMGDNFKSPASIDIFQDKVYILMWDQTPYVFTIKNKNIAEGFKHYFEFLWNMAKR
tara:strand:+ start:35564 stop:36301 length:738 start_codon:yes stop_codon:yes gene_type:complete